MSQATILALSALGCALFLVVAKPARPFAIGAAIVCAVDVALRFHVLQISFPHMELALAAAVTIAGVLLILRVEQKPRVIAATVVAAVGAIEVLTVLL